MKSRHPHASLGCRPPKKLRRVKSPGVGTIKLTDDRASVQRIELGLKCRIFLPQGGVGLALGFELFLLGFELLFVSLGGLEQGCNRFLEGLDAVVWLADPHPRGWQGR